MNHCWSFYRLDTGAFTGRLFTGPDNAVEINTPSGCGAVLGAYEKRTQIVDLRTGLVVRRERPGEEIAEESRRRRVVAVQAHILELEQRQARRVRELLAASDPMLKELDDEIRTLRAELATPSLPTELSDSTRPAAESPRGA